MCGWPPGPVAQAGLQVLAQLSKCSVGKAANQLGGCYSCLGQYDKAFEGFTRALDLREKIGNSWEIAASLNNLGGCSFFLGQFQKAIEHYTHALELRQEIGNPGEIAASPLSIPKTRPQRTLVSAPRRRLSLPKTHPRPTR